MNTIRRIPTAWSILALAVVAPGTTISCGESAGSAPRVEASARPGPTADHGRADPRVEPYRSELIDVAFDAASAFPLVPHVKNRSRAQATVVAACLELDQPARAIELAERIADWRRGQCIADVADHLAARGETEGVEAYLERAIAIADGALEPAPKSAGDAREPDRGWSRDRIRAAVARTYLRLDLPEKAKHVSAGVAEAELGPVRAESARRVRPDDFDAEIAALDAQVAGGAFDSARAALDAYVELFDRSYADVARRDLVESKIAHAWARLPIQVRLDVGIELADRALAHDDATKALALVDAAQGLLDLTRWSTEAQVPARANLAAARHRAGDKARARADLDAALAAYAADRASIVDVYRAAVLRPVAEAYAAIGDAPKAREVYRKALEEGALNPNSRPRADDLVATSISLALAGVEPDAALFARIRAIRAQLGDPW